MNSSDTAECFSLRTVCFVALPHLFHLLAFETNIFLSRPTRELDKLIQRKHPWVGVRTRMVRLYADRLEWGILDRNTRHFEPSYGSPVPVNHLFEVLQPFCFLSVASDTSLVHSRFVSRSCLHNYFFDFYQKATPCSSKNT